MLSLRCEDHCIVVLLLVPTSTSEALEMTSSATGLHKRPSGIRDNVK